MSATECPPGCGCGFCLLDRQERGATPDPDIMRRFDPFELARDEVRALARANQDLRAALDRANKLIGEAADEATHLRAALAERDARIRELEEALRPEVRWFAGEMERKLRANDHKSHWSECDFPYLDGRLDEELDELRAAMGAFAFTGNASCVIDEAADVANFAMMIADNAAALSRKGTP